MSRLAEARRRLRAAASDMREDGYETPFAMARAAGGEMGFENVVIVDGEAWYEFIRAVDELDLALTLEGEVDEILGIA